jgi:restriction system protein
MASTSWTVTMKIIQSTLWFLLYWFFLTIAALIIFSFAPADGSNLSLLVAMSSLFLPPAAAFLLVKRRNRKKRLAAEELQQSSTESKNDLLRRRFVERERLIDLVDQHRTALTRNLARATKKNDYGVVTEDNSVEAINEFIASVSLDETAIPFSEAVSVIYEQLGVLRDQELNIGFDPRSVPIDGLEFERWVADSLQSFGWEASPTVGSGDQGIDVIAQINSKRLGIQCKLYSSAVGNKAVQEAVAGKAYHGVDTVAVLSNASFTQSAKDLALMNQVHLISHHDIPNLEQIVFGKTNRH